MKTTRYLTLAALVIATSLIVGCGPSRLELDYGTSQRLVKTNQILDPQAGQTDAPVTGLDGEAAKNAYTDYRQSFTKSRAETGGIIEQ